MDRNVPLPASSAIFHWGHPVADDGRRGGRTGKGKGKDVAAAYKRLDERWDEIVAQLKKLPIPCTVSHVFARVDSGEYRAALEWRKWRGEKVICIATYEWSHNAGEEECTIKLYPEWSAEQRLEMLKHVPGLFAEAVVQVKDFVKQITGKEVEDEPLF